MSKKQIEIVLSLCQRWGYGGKIAGIEANLIEPLGEKYDVKVVEEPIRPGNGEYYIYLKKGNEKKILFSNDNSHKEDYTVIGNSVRGDLAQKVMETIDKMV